MIDLTNAAERTAAVLTAISDDHLGAPTPCPSANVADLIDHVGGLALAFALAATKQITDPIGPAPIGDGSRLGDDWRDGFPERLAALAAAWREPAAWRGVTQAGPVETV